MATPTTITASDGTYTDKVAISSYAVSGATSSGGSKNYLGGTSSSTYYDTSAAVEMTYYYFVRACNSAGCSDFTHLRQNPPKNPQ